MSMSKFKAVLEQIVKDCDEFECSGDDMTFIDRMEANIEDAEQELAETEVV